MRRWATVVAGVVLCTGLTAVPGQAASLAGGEARQVAAPVLGEELVGLRTDRSRTFPVGGDTFRTEVSAGPMHVREGDGWVPIANEWVAAEGGWASRRSPFEAFAPALLADGVTVADGPVGMRLRLPEAAPTSVEVAGGVTRYHDALGSGVDVSYELSYGSLKESVVLPDLARAGALGRVQAEVSGVGDVELVPAGGEVAVVSGGEIKMVVAQPFMVDAAGEEGLVEVTAVRQGGVVMLDLVPDQGWLAAEGRTWPVVIDPPVSVGPSKDCWLDQRYPTAVHCTNARLRAGLDATGQQHQTVLQFDVESNPLPVPQQATIVGHAEALRQHLLRHDGIPHPAEGVSGPDPVRCHGLGGLAADELPVADMGLPVGGEQRLADQ